MQNNLSQSTGEVYAEQAISEFNQRNVESITNSRAYAEIEDDAVLAQNSILSSTSSQVFCRPVGASRALEINTDAQCNSHELVKLLIDTGSEADAIDELYNSIVQQFNFSDRDSNELAEDIIKEANFFRALSGFNAVEVRLRFETPPVAEQLLQAFNVSSGPSKAYLVDRYVNNLIGGAYQYHLDSRALCASKTYGGESTLFVPNTEVFDRSYGALMAQLDLALSPDEKRSLCMTIFNQLCVNGFSTTLHELLNVIAEQQIRPIILSQNGKIYASEGNRMNYFIGCVETEVASFGCGRAALHCKPIIDRSTRKATDPRLVLLMSTPENAASSFLDALNG